MVGSLTVIADDPLLTCRLPGLAHRSPVRIVVDSRLRVPLTARIVADAQRAPTWFLTLRGGDALRQEAFRACGVELIEVEPDGGVGVAMAAGLRALGARGVTRVLAEGGSHVAASLLRDRLVDRIAWFRAPRLIGGDGIPAVAAFGLEHLAAAPGFVRCGLIECGEDVLETYRRTS
jgi:diaminohydroxyphosphoribosylaminopyrimidine deaminase / 5-amino-6-(5-phosphoribosylamino)uracil reductase